MKWIRRELVGRKAHLICEHCAQSRVVEPPTPELWALEIHSFETLHKTCRKHPSWRGKDCPCLVRKPKKAEQLKIAGT